MKSQTEEIITGDFVQDVCERLSLGKSVRRSLPGGGFLSIDRQLPFLCVYRRDPEFEDSGTHLFASHEAAYLSAPGKVRVRKGLNSLVQHIVESSAQRFGGFLILEIRAAPASEIIVPQDARTGEVQLPRPGFRIHATAEHPSTEAVNTLHFGLEQIRVDGEDSNVEVRLNEHPHAPGLKPLLSNSRQAALRCHIIGLEILPIYRDPESGRILPDLLEELRRKVSKVLKKTFFSFVVRHTSLRPHHYYALGRSRIVRSVWDIDHRLSVVSQQLDLILMSTPINAESSWHAFEESDYQTAPVFQTRPLPFDPFLLKRELMAIPTERVDDPTLAHLFREVQNELDRQLTMLSDIGTPRFVHGSLQVFGGVEPPLLELAKSLLNLTGKQSAADTVRKVGPVAFAHKAELEIQRYRKRDPSFTATVELRSDLYSGLMVSGTKLLVGRETSVLSSRVVPLLAHEVGTHLVTRHNGMQQPMQLLQSGLAGYDPLQEGLAVLAEYLVGGLTLNRLRLLAARVVATDALIRGRGFCQTFGLLVEKHGFEHHFAFTVVLRVFRGGGLTKDAAYLRGLNQVIQYLGAGGELEPLYVGKLATTHIPLIRELLLREVLQPPALLPRHLTTAAAVRNLARLRKFLSVLDLAKDLTG